jgi:hypothetical protein
MAKTENFADVIRKQLAADPALAKRVESSTLHGDQEDGIEIRRDEEGELDEIIVYRDGRCVVHIEAMSDQMFWMSLASKRFVAHCNVGAKRAHVKFFSAEVFREEEK